MKSFSSVRSGATLNRRTRRLEAKDVALAFMMTLTAFSVAATDLTSMKLIKITGDTSGIITVGENGHAGYDDFASVLEHSHNVSIPLDADTGLPSGTAQHGSFKIVKEISKSSPKLLQALDTGE